MQVLIFKQTGHISFSFISNEPLFPLHLPKSISHSKQISADSVILLHTIFHLVSIITLHFHLYYLTILELS